MHASAQTFDELLLLKRGGSVIFNGKLGAQSADMIAYFQQLPRVPAIADGYSVPPTPPNRSRIVSPQSTWFMDYVFLLPDTARALAGSGASWWCSDGRDHTAAQTRRRGCWTSAPSPPRPSSASTWPPCTETASWPGAAADCRHHLPLSPPLTSFKTECEAAQVRR